MPRQVVLIGARIARVATARLAHRVTRQLQRGKPREVTDALRRHLVDRNTDADVGAVGFASPGAGEKRGIGPRMIARAIVARLGILVIQPPENLDGVLQWSERRHRAAQSEIRPGARRPPVVLMRPVRKINIGHAQGRPRGGDAQRTTRQRRRRSGPRRRPQGRLEHRQGHARTKPAQKLPAAEGEMTLRGDVTS